MSRARTVSRFVLSAFMISAGVMHFAQPDFFLKIMPPYLPLHYPLVLISGAMEIALGLMLLFSATGTVAAWGIMALLIAVFPANLYLFQNQDILPAPAIVHLLRLPLQGVLVFWAYSHTRNTVDKGKQQ